MVLVFNLSEEESAAKAAFHGLDWALVVWHVDQELRKKLKYGDAEKFADAGEALQWVRKLIRETCKEQGVDMEDIE